MASWPFFFSLSFLCLHTSLITSNYFGYMYTRRKWQPTTIFLLLKTHRQRRQATVHGGHKESDTGWATKQCVCVCVCVCVQGIKNPPVNAGHRRSKFDPWTGNILWRKKCQSTPAFLPGKSHEQRSLADYCSWGYTELSTTEWLRVHTCMCIFMHVCVFMDMPDS